MSQEVLRHLVREGFEQPGRTSGDEALQLKTDRGVIHRAREIIAELGERAARLQAKTNGEPLRMGALFIRNADLRHQLQLLDSDLVVRHRHSRLFFPGDKRAPDLGEALAQLRGLAADRQLSDAPCLICNARATLNSTGFYVVARETGSGGHPGKRNTTTVRSSLKRRG
jgi:hypothetical protein